MDLLTDLVALALLAKLLWELGTQGLIGAERFALFALALPFLLGLGGRSTRSLIRPLISVVVLALFLVVLKVQGVSSAYAGLLAALVSLYLFGRFARATARHVLSLGILLIVAYVLYRSVLTP